nr:MAG TPA: zinc finger domain-containing protein [Caudoviricetes sp.]
MPSPRSPFIYRCSVCSRSKSSCRSRASTN